MIDPISISIALGIAKVMAAAGGTAVATTGTTATVATGATSLLAGKAVFAGLGPSVSFFSKPQSRISYTNTNDCSYSDS